MQLAMQQRVLFPKRVTVAHNAVPVPMLVPDRGARLRRELLGDTGRHLVLTVARLDAQKGLDTLLRAATRVRGATFVIAGEGRERAHLEATIRSLSLEGRVVLLGHRSDVAELLAACDMFVLPSEYEGLPVSVLEAMAAEKPVIVTDVGGSNEVVRHEEQGLLVPVGDDAALAAAIERVTSDPGLARRLARSGRERVSGDFSAEALIGRLRDIYSELVETSPARRGHLAEAR
jgi:glycosyltransferase involved in cell wall biosynthesis